MAEEILPSVLDIEARARPLSPRLRHGGLPSSSLAGRWNRRGVGYTRARPSARSSEIPAAPSSCSSPISTASTPGGAESVAATIGGMLLDCTVCAILSMLTILAQPGIGSTPAHRYSSQHMEETHVNGRTERLDYYPHPLYPTRHAGHRPLLLGLNHAGHRQAAHARRVRYLVAV